MKEPVYLDDLKPEQVLSGVTILDLADKLRALKERKDALKKEEKELNEAIDKTEKELAELMIQEEIQNFSRGGKLFYLQNKVYASAVAHKKQELYAWLKENGYGDLVYETVNANSFSAFIKELLEEEPELPEGLKDMVNIHEKTTIGMRKA